jgi:hypothetical protein
MPTPSSGVLDQLDAACRAAECNADDVLELSRAMFATETSSADVLVVLMRELLVHVAMHRRGFFKPAAPVATVHHLADYRDLGELDDADLPGPAVMFLAPDEGRHFMLIWHDRRERDRMFAAIFDAHRRRYARWGLRLNPANYVADYDRYYTEIRANGPTEQAALDDWVQREYGEFDLTNALGFAVEWRRCELGDDGGTEPSDRVMRISFPVPWDVPEARPIIVRLGEQLYDEGLLAPPYDERTFETGEPLNPLDAGPARLIALITLAAYATALGHPRAGEWSEEARRTIPAVPETVFSDRHRALLARIGGLPTARAESVGELSSRNLAACLDRWYTDRWPGHPDELEELVEELRACGYTSLDEVSDMLGRTKDEFLAREREEPPGAQPGATFAGPGVIRVSLRLDGGR